MKNFLTTLSLILLFVSLKAQTDFIIGGTGFSPISIGVGDTSEFTALVAVNETESNGSLGIGCLQVIISLPANGTYVIDSMPLKGFGTSFNWVYIPADKAYYGTNNVVLVDGDGGLISLKVVGAMLTSNPTATSINISDVLNCSNSNNGSNDGAYASLSVVAALPVNLSFFNSITKNCEEISLNWKTQAEVNSSHFEIFRSKDGLKFDFMDFVASTNLVGGSNYSYLDKKNLQHSSKYYYQLVQVDFDGNRKKFDIIEQLFKCSNSDNNFTIFPNPTLDYLNLSFSGFDNENLVQLNIYNNLGEVVKKLTTNPRQISRVDLSDLPNGMYEIQLVHESKIIAKKFIKIS